MFRFSPSFTLSSKLKSEKCTVTVTYGITSVQTTEVDAAMLERLWRNHSTVYYKARTSAERDADSVRSTGRGRFSPCAIRSWPVV
jgi:hypothetical protein